MVTGDTFLAMIESTVSHHLTVGTDFQSDGAPPHFDRSICTFLDRQFSDRWLGRVGPIPWPPRFPDLTPLDFFT
jgi:hypothetical protein